MTDDRIVSRLIGSVCSIELNDASSRNALTTAMADELTRILVNLPSDARVVLLSGHGAAFCSGANLRSGAMDLRDPYRDAGLELAQSYNPLMLALRHLEVPLVTSVRGAAAGIGCALALMGDIIVAADDAYFVQAFRHIGLVPDGGSSHILARAVGRVRAMQMMLLGEKISAKTALEWGLVTRVVANAELDDHAFEVARDLGAGPAALGLIRRQAWAALDEAFEKQIQEERLNQRTAGRSMDFVEGVRAFSQKRLPQFTGN